MCVCAGATLQVERSLPEAWPLGGPGMGGGVLSCRCACKVGGLCASRTGSYCIEGEMGWLSSGVWERHCLPSTSEIFL